MGNWVMGASAALGFLGVALGAFGAHAMRSRLAPAMMDVWQTASQYHLIHAVAILAMGVWLNQMPHSMWLKWAAVAMLAGVLVFSGSLYLLSATGLRWLGAVTPLGGVGMLLGWALLVVAVLKR